MSLGVIDLTEVDSESHGDVGLLGRRGDHDLAGSGIEVFLRARAVTEEPGRLDHDVDPELGPRQVRRIGLARHRDRDPVDDYRAVRSLDSSPERPVDRVVPE